MTQVNIDVIVLAYTVETCEYLQYAYLSRFPLFSYRDIPKDIAVIAETVILIT